MFYKYSEIKNDLIEQNASRPPKEESVRHYFLDLLENHPKGLQARYNGKSIIILWEDIVLICAAALKTSYKPAQITIDIFIPELSGSFRIIYDDIVFTGFPFRLYGTISQNFEAFMNYLITKNSEIKMDNLTLNFLKELTQEKKKTSNILDMISKKTPEMHQFKTLLDYEKFVWRTYADFQKKYEALKSISSREHQYCIILKNFPPSKRKEIVESIAIIKKISQEEASKRLDLPMILGKNLPSKEADSISKELKFIDADVRLITMSQFKKIRNLKNI